MSAPFFRREDSLERRSHAIVSVQTAPDDQGLVKSAARVLHVLEYFGEIQRPARAKEIAEALGLPQSSTSVLLKSLSQLGYLEFEPEHRTYMPSPRVALLGAWLSQGGVSISSVMQLMQELSQETAMTITLSARNGIYAQYIHVIQATTTLRLYTPQGTNRLLAWSAAGFALISRMSDADIHDLVLRTNSELASHKRRLDLTKVMQHVQSFRKQGYFFSRELVTPGGGHISMLLPSRSGWMTQGLALGVSGWIDDIQREEAHIVKAMRRGIAEHFGSAVQRDKSRGMSFD
jgi:DNA-binding IclR family transcriptional regulator